MKLSTIHPFPARMAPEIIHESLKVVPQGGSILDPMCGSGTVVRAAAEAGFRCVGVDIDPLAVLMSRVWTTPLDSCKFLRDVEDLVFNARNLSKGSILDIFDTDTQNFISYWFANPQMQALTRLATVLRLQPEPSRSACAIALSRIIVTKEMMASLARDTSHSRPHRVSLTNNFDVYAGFLRAARYVVSKINSSIINGQVDVHRGDARSLTGIEDASFDLILTSPPYLNAIDYLRGHRLALVWLGYDMSFLRETRRSSIGAERILTEDESDIDISSFIVENKSSTIGSNHRGWIRRYASDMDAVLCQIRRVVKPTGRALLVLGNSFIRGALVNNADLMKALAKHNNLQVGEEYSRDIPARRRYLPPPGKGTGSMDTRMRTETILSLRPV